MAPSLVVSHRCLAGTAAVPFDRSSLRWVSSIRSFRLRIMYRSIKPRSHQLCYAARMVAVCLVDLRLQHGPARG
jgi:hypothetical protein